MKFDRHRRLRSSATMRDMVRENHVRDPQQVTREQIRVREATLRHSTSGYDHLCQFVMSGLARQVSRLESGQ